MPVTLTPEQLLLINLLLRVIVMAGIASLVLQFRFVSNFVLGRSVSVMDRVRMGVLLAAIFIVCVVVRKFTYQGAMDLSLEGSAPSAGSSERSWPFPSMRRRGS
jgi:hypothetical protein